MQRTNRAKLLPRMPLSSLVPRWTILTVPFFDISNDGHKLLLERLSQQVSQSVKVVTNFPEGLKQ